MPIIPCQACGGEGRIWKSRYGGNDPDVWDAGECPNCEGSGNEPCDNCGEEAATEKLTEAGQTFNLCKPCAVEWREDDA